MMSMLTNEDPDETADAGDPRKGFDATGKQGFNRWVERQSTPIVFPAPAEVVGPDDAVTARVPRSCLTSGTSEYRMSPEHIQRRNAHDRGAQGGSNAEPRWAATTLPVDSSSGERLSQGRDAYGRTDGRDTPANTNDLSVRAQALPRANVKVDVGCGVASSQKFGSRHSLSLLAETMTRTVAERHLVDVDGNQPVTERRTCRSVGLTNDLDPAGSWARTNRIDQGDVDSKESGVCFSPGQSFEGWHKIGRCIGERGGSGDVYELSSIDGLVG